MSKKNVFLLCILIHHSGKVWCSEILINSGYLGNQCLWQARTSSQFWLCHPSCEYYFIMIHCVHISIINPRSLLLSLVSSEVCLSEPSCEPPFLRSVSFLELCLSALVHIVESVGIYRTTERLKRRHRQKQNLKKKKQQTEIK